MLPVSGLMNLAFSQVPGDEDEMFDPEDDIDEDFDDEEDLPPGTPLPNQDNAGNPRFGGGSDTKGRLGDSRYLPEQKSNVINQPLPPPRKSNFDRGVPGDGSVEFRVVEPYEFKKPKIRNTKPPKRPFSSRTSKS